MTTMERGRAAVEWLKARPAWQIFIVLSGIALISYLFQIAQWKTVAFSGAAILYLLFFAYLLFEIHYKVIPKIRHRYAAIERGESQWIKHMIKKHPRLLRWMPLFTVFLSTVAYFTFASITLVGAGLIVIGSLLGVKSLTTTIAIGSASWGFAITSITVLLIIAIGLFFVIAGVEFASASLFYVDIRRRTIIKYYFTALEEASEKDIKWLIDDLRFYVARLFWDVAPILKSRARTNLRLTYVFMRDFLTFPSASPRYQRKTVLKFKKQFITEEYTHLVCTIEAVYRNVSKKCRRDTESYIHFIRKVHQVEPFDLFTYLNDSHTLWAKGKRIIITTLQFLTQPPILFVILLILAIRFGWITTETLTAIGQFVKTILP